MSNAQAQGQESTMAERVRFEGFRDYRYGEILNLFHSDERGHWADVWNTMMLNDCPPAAFKAIDLQAFAKETGSLMAIPNGPRFWIWDAIEAPPNPEPLLCRAGELDMSLVATLEIGDGPLDRLSFTDRSVARDNIWEFAAHAPRFYLHGPDGIHYVMQAYATYVDETLTLNDLADLGANLHVPDGWHYAVDLDPATTLRVDCGPEKMATVLQDDLGNSYQRLSSFTEIEPS